ncbi:MAG: BlaI/MecI/CopY family transcriptional regulator [Clostridiales bacterium]|nr:BlaI/MecI/CopY family transcriptional regulator [Clostridiales bacterium]
MEDYRLGVVETRFAELIWSHEPLTSGELVKLCAKELEWKKSTTYTVLKKLCDRGIFQNQDGLVTSVLSQKEFQSRQSRRFVEDTFSGSLPAFIAAFAEGGELSDQELLEIRKMIDSYGRGEKE